MRLFLVLAFKYLCEIHPPLSPVTLVCDESKPASFVWEMISQKHLEARLFVVIFIFVSLKIGKGWLLKLGISNSVWVTYFSRICPFHLFSSFWHCSSQ